MKGKNLRCSILQELYDVYHKNKKGFLVIPTQGEPLNDLEVFNAYKYLNDKKYISFQLQGRNAPGNKNYQVYILFQGIDVVESWEEGNKKL
ncbi:hypothetical protein QE450_000834 [Paenibacillus sp. SORGH_AS306]|uniref:hypothetical protein n=1 Tax=Paenibacillus sp. SORGH_AS_0306 TaxID=3041754 RepID=UPI0027889B15|nr:hypothetical protein [Paenibacillus sp. SORGH_AS_0306]MDQ1233336.1 hypothetical protein [Paenibacillus sp. SORGH_AS_0306]